MTVATIVMAVATVVLVLVNIFYLVLTWKSLREAREASLRDRESRHLDKIKAEVIEPIVSWIETVVFRAYAGNTRALLTFFGGTANAGPYIEHMIRDPFAGSRLDVGVRTPVFDAPIFDDRLNGTISKFLFDHTKRDHFRNDLMQFEDFLDTVRHVTGQVLQFAMRCADHIGAGGLPIVGFAQENTMPQWSNPLLFAINYVESALSKTDLYVRRVPQTGGPCMLLVNGFTVGKALEEENLLSWADRGRRIADQEWHNSALSRHIEKLKKDASAVLENIEQLRYTEGLGVDCELVSGKRRRHR